MEKQITKVTFAGESSIFHIDRDKNFFAFMSSNRALANNHILNVNIVVRRMKSLAARKPCLTD